MRVMQFLVCVDGEQFRTSEPSRTVLRGVGYYISAPSGLAFPILIPRLRVFTRFYDFIGGNQFQIKVYWHSPDGLKLLRRRVRKPIEFSGFNRVEDYLFPIQNIRLQGPGLHEIRLTSVQLPKIILARDFLEVTQQ